jgi:hypothetical protein
MGDPMWRLRQLRRFAVEQARAALGACLTAENQIAERIAAIDAAVQRDLAADAALDHADRFRDMFVRRTEARRVERSAAQTALAAAQARSAVARAGVVAARTAAEAVETLIGERAVAVAAAVARAEQHALDDMARARVDFPHKGGIRRTR